MLEPNDHEKRQDFNNGIGLGILYIIVNLILTVLLYSWIPTNAIIVIYNLNWPICFGIIYLLSKRKKRDFLKGFLVGLFLTPLILIGACFGLFFVINFMLR